MSATSATAGRILDGRYELRALIGQGTFGRVYRGHDQRLDRAVAIKVIKPGWTEGSEWVERFEREAQLMARVSHPGIVQIHDIGYDRAGLYYVAELVEGESLAARLRRGPLAPSDARAIAAQLCSALAEAHAQGVVHRDVKPANVLLAGDIQVKVTDFGIARLAGDEGSAGTVIGTPGYMAPEQVAGRAPTPATDVYGVGAVLREMLAGSAPPALEEIVERALAQEPADRYPSASEMADALVRAELARSAGGAPASSPAAKRNPAPTRIRARLTPRVDVNPGERRRYLALQAVVLLLLLAMIATVIVTSTATVRVPDFHGMSRAAVVARARARHLRVSFTSRYDSLPAGTAISERPAAGARVGDGSTISIALSAGPQPVEVPQLMGQQSGVAQAILARLGLSATVKDVPAPGVTPGLVVAQTPPAMNSLVPGRAVVLSVAETPRWRPITSFSGDGPGRSVAFTVEGKRWRVTYSTGYDGTCGFLGLFCSGPSAQVLDRSTGLSAGRFDLNEGSGQTQLFGSGPGTYQIAVTPGSDSAHWSIRVDDFR